MRVCLCVKDVVKAVDGIWQTKEIIWNKFKTKHKKAHHTDPYHVLVIKDIIFCLFHNWATSASDFVDDPSLLNAFSAASFKSFILFRSNFPSSPSIRLLE